MSWRRCLAAAWARIRDGLLLGQRARGARARELIDARQYVLRSQWGDVQPSAADGTAYLEKHSWEDYAGWHLGLTDGATEETKGRYALRLRRLPAAAPDGAHRLPVPGRGVGAQGRRAGRARAAAVPGRLAG